MTSFRAWLAMGLIVAAGGTPLGAQTPDQQMLPTERARQQQQIQQQVRLMARQLVGSVLDLQLQQLRENGLKADPWYKEINAMREHLDDMIAAEMPQVIALLTKVETTGEAQRQQTFRLAREKSREIVVRLLVERQALLRRLRIAEMVAQVQQLIQVQTKVRDATESLPAQPTDRRPAMNVTALEDQRDVQATYKQFKVGLVDVSRWTGPFGTEAGEGLKLLAKNRVDEELVSAETRLQSAQFTEASASQKAVIDGLRALLIQMQQAQKAAEKDANALAEKIREAMEKQEAVRKATEQARPDTPEMEKLVGEQAEVKKDISKMNESPQASSEVKSSLEKAQQAAQEARSNLFEQKKNEALAEQEKVMKDLEDALQAAQKSESAEAGKLSDADLQKLIDDLEGAAKDLEKAQEDQSKASKTAQKDPSQAGKQEEQVAQELGKVPENRDLPKPVESAVENAEKAASHAAQDVPKANPQQRKQDTTKAERAIEQAKAETAAALADAKRQQQADKMQQLANAAEALDKAAGKEREVAKESQAAAKDKGMSAEQAKGLQKEQKDVGQTAKDVGESMKQMAPEAADTLRQAEKPIAEAGQKLGEAEKQSGEASKQPAAKAAEQAQEAAGELAKAADQVRKELQKAAEEMAKLTQQQMDQVAQTRQNVEQELGKTLDPLSERIQRLEKAREKVNEAKADQAKAAGGEKPKDSEQGQKPDMAAQKGVTEKAKEAKDLAQPDAPQAADTLEQAAQSSETAREEGGQGSPEKAAAAQKQTAGKLAEAGKQLDEAIQGLMAQAAPQFAQEAQAAGELASQASAVDPGATAALHGTQDQAQQGSQEGVRQGLGDAASSLAARQQQIAGDMAQANALAQAAMPGQALSTMPKPGQASALANGGGGATSGQEQQNLLGPERPLVDVETTKQAIGLSADSKKDSDAKGKEFIDEPWFAKLPPEMRNALRNTAARRPPRGYEERLQRYFENLDQ